MTPFGAKVRELRRKRGITLKDMAGELQVSSAYLSALEHGKRGRPTWFMVHRIIGFFNVIWDEAEELQRLAEISDPLYADDLARILGNSSCFFSLQSINVPVFHGFAAAVQIRFDAATRIEDCVARLQGLEKLVISSQPASPISDCNQSFSCVISHLEQAPDQPSYVQFWMLADPLRYGLATNYMHVTEFLLKSFL